MIENESGMGSSENRSRSWLLPAMGGVLALVVGLAWYQNTELQKVRGELAAKDANQQKEVAALRAIVAKADYQMEGVLGELRNEVAKTRQEATVGVKQAQALAVRRADAIAGQMEKKQKLHEQQFNEELAKVKESNEDASNRLTSISTEVGNVKTEMETTKTHIDNTITDLQRVRGDMGVMSGLIATNAKEIQYLREMGDRNIYEFTLAKSAGLQQVGDIRLALKSADLKRNRFTVEVLSDDKRVEKKDKTLNEPIQFYVASKAKQPYELVVNEVKKNTIIGYLATPKVQLAQGGRTKQ